MNIITQAVQDIPVIGSLGGLVKRPLDEAVAEEVLGWSWWQQTLNSITRQGGDFVEVEKYEFSLLETDPRPTSPRLRWEQKTPTPEQRDRAYNGRLPKFSLDLNACHSAEVAALDRLGVPFVETYSNLLRLQAGAMVSDPFLHTFALVTIDAQTRCRLMVQTARLIAPAVEVTRDA